MHLLKTTHFYFHCLISLKDSFEVRQLFAALLFFFFNSYSLSGYCQNDSSITPLVSKLSSVKGKDASNLLNTISERYRNNGNNAKALFYAEQAYEHAKKIDDYEGEAWALINQGIVKRNIGKMDEAIHLFTEARKLAEGKKSLTLQASAFHKIGVTYLLLKDFEAAKYYADLELEIWRSTQKTIETAQALNFLGLVHLNQGKFNLAEQTLDSALNMATAARDTSLMYKSLVNLGDVQLRQNNPETAKEFIGKSLQLSKATNNHYGIAVNYYKMGEALASIPNREKDAIANVQNALIKAKDLGYLTLERNCYDLLSQLYEQSGNFSQALEYRKIYSAKEDTMLRSLLQQKAEELELNFALEKRVKELELQEKDKANNQLIIALLLLIIISLGTFSFLYIRKNKRDKRSEKILKNKNQEISTQAEELEKKQTLLFKQAEKLASQKIMLDNKSQKIEESLDYAKQVQDSLLPPNQSFMNIFSNHFVHNLPQDVISGDFHWYTHQGDSISIVVADCSGHGVSGAFNTVIINSLVAQVINETNYRTPADLLLELHKRILRLIPTNQYINFNIGIKIGVIKINVNSLRMVYAGAKIPLYYINDNKLRVLKPDKVFVGGSHYADISNRFNNRMLKLNKGDKLIIATDGFQDQFGSDGKGKFMVKHLRKLLSETSQLSLEEQRETLITTFYEWKGFEAQTDDILIFGIQV